MQTYLMIISQCSTIMMYSYTVNNAGQSEIRRYHNLLHTNVRKTSQYGYSLYIAWSPSRLFPVIVLRKLASVSKDMYVLIHFHQQTKYL